MTHPTTRTDAPGFRSNIPCGCVRFIGAFLFLVVTFLYVGNVFAIAFPEEDEEAVCWSCHFFVVSYCMILVTGWNGIYYLVRLVQRQEWLAKIRELEGSSTQIQGRVIKREKTIDEITGCDRFLVMIEYDSSVVEVIEVRNMRRVVVLDSVLHCAEELYERSAQLSTMDLRLMMGQPQSVLPEYLFQSKLKDLRFWSTRINTAIMFVCLSLYLATFAVMNVLKNGLLYEAVLVPLASTFFLLPLCVFNEGVGL